MNIKRVIVTWVDPWTGEFLAGFDAPYTKQRAANSFYSRQAKAILPIAKQWAGPRKPKLKVKFIRHGGV